MSRSAADLEPLRGMKEEDRAAIQKQTEYELGLRCVGCERRIVRGLRARVIEVALVQGRPSVTVASASVCDHAECDAEARLRERAVCLETIELEWLDAPTIDAPLAPE